MSLSRIFSHEFEDSFNGRTILDQDIEKKLNVKHKVYEEDILDGLEDPYLVVMKSTRNSATPKDKEKSRGRLLEILGATEASRVIFIIGRLFPNGTLYIITAYWADPTLEKVYHQESEVLRDE